MENYVGEIRMFAGNYAPDGWFLCDGRELKIAEYRELYNAITILFGGDDQTTFKLPDLRGRTPVRNLYPRGATFGRPNGNKPIAAASGSQQITQSFLCINFIIAHRGETPKPVPRPGS